MLKATSNNMKRLKNISIALIIGLMGLGSSVAYAFPAHNDISVNVAQPSVKASTGAITLTVSSDNAVQFQIYSITGQAIKSITVGQGSTTIELPRGYYIVKCSYWSKTVVVK